MNNASVYLLFDSEEIYLGSVAEVLEAIQDPTEIVSRALVRAVADIVDDLVNNPDSHATTEKLIIEIR